LKYLKKAFQKNNADSPYKNELKTIRCVLTETGNMHNLSVIEAHVHETPDYLENSLVKK